MENLQDSPARYDENVHYLKDPTAPRSKPYSSKQVAANEAHKLRVTLYHKTHGAKRFNLSEAEAMKAEGWRDEPYSEKKTETKEPEETPTLELLRKEAKKMGIKVDKRWGEERLKQEMLRDDRSDDN